MASLSRVSGNDTAVGTIYAVNVNLFLLTVKKLDTVAVDLMIVDS